ncbi:unnamed protein product [Gordionus sp. m RMFG-2023]
MTSERKKPEIELFIKASNIDGVRNGACIFCHKWFMVLYQKSKSNELALTVTTVNMKQYPKEIKELTHSQPPILLNEDLAMPEERILDHLREEFPDPEMFASRDNVKKKIENVYSKFNHFLAATNEESEQRAEKSLLYELQTINNHLAHQMTNYLCGDQLSIYDCELMPKLQHIRVAGRAYKKFEIPHALSYLWTYIANMYQLDAFKETCPADQDIIANYRGKAKSDFIGSPRAQEALEQPTYTLDTPNIPGIFPGILPTKTNGIDNGNHHHQTSIDISNYGTNSSLHSSNSNGEDEYPPY